MSAPSVPADHGHRGSPSVTQGEPRPRCAWCKRFVKRATALTCWRVRVPESHRQRSDDGWNYWARLLCPACSPHIETIWWKPVTLGQVIDRRPEGLPTDHPQWVSPFGDSPLLATAPYLMFGTDPHERDRL